MEETRKDQRRGRPKGTGSQRVYEELKRRILRLDLAPGTDIEELGLVKEYSVSRTPVREALIRLATDGLVTIMPNRGARVSPLDLTDLPELLEGLDLCLRLTASWAAVRRRQSDVDAMRKHAAAWEQAARAGNVEAITEANNELHWAITVAAHNKHLAALYRSLVPGFLRLTHTLIQASPMESESFEEYANRVNSEHMEIVDAIENKDVRRADQISLTHANLIRERITRFLNKKIAIPPSALLPPPPIVPGPR